MNGQTKDEKYYKLTVLLDYIQDDEYINGECIVDKKFDEIDDIPKYIKSNFKTSMLDDLDNFGEYLEFQCEGIPHHVEDGPHREVYTFIIEFVHSIVYTENLTQCTPILKKLGVM